MGGKAAYHSEPPKPNPLSEINQPSVEPALLLEEDIFDRQFMHSMHPEELQRMESRIPFGERLGEVDIVRSRDDASNHGRIGEWEFKEIDNGQTVLLARKPDTIDWWE